MARGDVPTKPPTFKTIDWGAAVRKSWGDDWHKPEISYEFSSGKKYKDSGAQGGPYTGTSGNG